ncbi:MAG TPA: XrtA system polysaccharide chain length determinant [Candidatus Tectomicrobia bacterium]
MQAAQQAGGMDVAAVLGMWWRRKWLAIFIFAVVFTAVTSVAMFLPNVYQSTATILVERQQVPEAFVQTTVTSGIDLRLQTITQQVLSRARLEGLIQRFGLYADVLQQAPLEQVIETMRRDILLDQKRQASRGKDEITVAFSISYKGKNPQQVAQVANTIASFYIDENLKVRGQQATGTAEFLGTQLNEVKQKLEEQEKRLSQFKESYMGELPEQLAANLAVLEGLNAQVRLSGEKLTRSSEQRAALARQLAELEGGRSVSKTRAAVFPDTRPDANATRLEKLQQDLATLRTRYNENYPDIIWLKSEIALLEPQLSATDSPKKPGQDTEVPLNPYTQQLKKEFSTLDAEIKSLHAEQQNLLASIQLYQRRVENTPRRDQELQLILRDYDTAKSRYQSLLKRDEEAKLAENLEQRQKGEQFRLLEAALPGKKPVEPKRSKLLLMGLVAGLGLAGGSVVLLEQLRPSFHAASALGTFTQVPVLVSLPRIVTSADTRRRRWQFVLAVPATILILGCIVGSSYVALKKPVQLAALYAQIRSLHK